MARAPDPFPPKPPIGPVVLAGVINATGPERDGGQGRKAACQAVPGNPTLNEMRKPSQNTRDFEATRGVPRLNHLQSPAPEESVQGESSSARR